MCLILTIIIVASFVCFYIFLRGEVDVLCLANIGIALFVCLLIVVVIVVVVVIQPHFDN